MSLIAAVAVNRAIGVDGAMPWHLPDDLALFAALTADSALIMGRRTYESIGMPLKGRKNIVLSTSSPIEHRDVQVARTFDEAVVLAGAHTTYVIGGASVYAHFLPLADRFELTLVSEAHRADTFSPVIDPGQWCCEGHEAGKGLPAHSYHSLRRRTQAVGMQAGCISALGPQTPGKAGQPQSRIRRAES